MLFYQVGELFQSYAVGKSRKSIASLMDIRPDYRQRGAGRRVEEVDPEEVAVGTSSWSRPARMPLDGVVLEGSSWTPPPSPANPCPQVAPGQSSAAASTRTAFCGCRSPRPLGVHRPEDSGPGGKRQQQKAKAENFITSFARYYTPRGGAALFAPWPWRCCRRSLPGGLDRVGPPGADLSGDLLPLRAGDLRAAELFGGIGGPPAGILVKGGNYLRCWPRRRWWSLTRPAP